MYICSRQGEITKNLLIVCITTVALGVCYIVYTRNDCLSKISHTSNKDQLPCDFLSIECKIMCNLIRQRNKASKKANELQQEIGQLQCQMLANLNDTRTSRTGGWCYDSGKHFTDENLAEELKKLLKGKRVASFGEGPGKYKQLLENAGMGITYDAFDGSPFSYHASQGKVSFMDLTLYQFGLPVYDWVISLEVAEHIPREFESVYIDNINRHAKEGVILSWAVPGQGGYAHINNQPFDYVVEIMQRNGLHHNRDKSEVLQKAAKLSWLKTNINVFMRTEEFQSDYMMLLMA